MTDVPTTALTNADMSPQATPITTGASPVTADSSVRLYAITTGGTAGVEVLNIPKPDLPIGGFANGQLLGQQVAFFLQTQTDPSDSVHIGVVGGAIKVYPGVTGMLATQISGSVVLDFEGAMAVFRWCGDTWKFDAGLTDELDDSVFASIAATLRVPEASGADNGANLTVLGAAARGSGNAGSVTIQGGDADGAGAGGSVSIGGGSSGSGDHGYVLVSGLPEADPMQQHALFTDGPLVPGTPMQLWISAGPE